MKAVKGTINEALAKVASHGKEVVTEAEMSLDDIKKRYAKEIIAFQDDGKDLSSGAKMALYGYRGSDALKTDDADEFDNFVMGLQMSKYKTESVEINERETDKYGNPKLSDADKDKIGRLREQIAAKQKEVDRLKIQIAMIKKAAGLPL